MFLNILAEWTIFMPEIILSRKRRAMVKGLYTAYSGLTVQQKRLDVVSNNLANATTTGYKKEGLTT